MLIGVGLGPGDPHLLTLRAVEVLKSAIKVFVPGHLSYELVKPYADPEILEFPMTYDHKRLQSAWLQNVERISHYAGTGATAFAVLGDPNVFSTFSHLAETMRTLKPHIRIETIPGVSAITACLSRLDESVDASFVVSDKSVIKSALVLKATKPREIAESLRQKGFSHLVLLEKAFTESERLYEKEFPAKGQYFSIMYGKRA